MEFSKEMTESGPLYADFDMTISTPEVTVATNVGLKQVPVSRIGRI